MRILSPLFLAALFAASMATTAHAYIVQSVTTIYDDDGAAPVVATDSDSTTDFIVPILTDIQASIAVQDSFGDTRVQASGAVGIFGDLGVQATQTMPGLTLTGVSISNSEILNPGTLSRQAEARFIIDGGLLHMEAGQGSTLRFTLGLNGTVFDGVGSFDHFINWQSEILLTSLDNSGSNIDVQFLGPSIDAQVIGAGLVDIPISFQTVDLGLFPGMGSMSLSYSLDIKSDIQGYSEITNWKYSDPLSVDGASQFPTVAFLGEVASVPEPATPGLLVVGLGALWRCRRRAF